MNPVLTDRLESVRLQLVEDNDPILRELEKSLESQLEESQSDIDLARQDEQDASHSYLSDDNYFADDDNAGEGTWECNF